MRPVNQVGRLTSVILWMAGALFAFIVAALSIRTLSKELNAFEINFVRTGGGVLLLSAAFLFKPSLRELIDLRMAIKHVPRNIAHASGGFLWTMAIALLPLATVFSLEFTAPAWAALLAFPILGEKIRRDTIIGIAASLVGVLVILRPAPHTFQLTALLPLAAAFCLGLSALLTRRLTRHQSTFAILFWMMIIQMPINFVGVLVLARPAGAEAGLPLLSAIAMVTLAVSGLCSQLCLSKALQIGEASIVMPLDFLRVPLIALIGWSLYGERIDAWVLVGSVVIVGGIVFGLLPARARAAPRDSVDPSTAEAA